MFRFYISCKGQMYYQENDLYCIKMLEVVRANNRFDVALVLHDVSS